MSFKKYLINKTNRETIGYKIIDQLVFNLHKTKAKIKHNLFGNSDYSGYKKIHLGAGKTKLSGFLNSDILGDNPIDITKTLPFDNNSLELIYSSNLIEHIYLIEFQRFLKESYRVLKKGGNMIIVTPSLKAIFNNKRNLKPLINRFTEIHSNLKSNTFSEYLNFMIHLGFGHKYLYDSDLIIFLAKKAGFSEARVINYQQLTNREIVHSIERELDTVKIAETIVVTK